MAKTAGEIARELSSAPFESIPGLLELYADDSRKQVADALARARRRMEREGAERERVQKMYDAQATFAGPGLVAGLDEVGRGAVAGPLTVCAVVLDPSRPIWGINDSKQLTPAKRKELSEKIREEALAFNIAHIEPNMIDSLGMSACLRTAFSQAVSGLSIDPDCVLVDGNPLHIHPREKSVVKGDATYAAIAAASIVAKVERDEFMVELSRSWPAYGFDSCKGYASAEHIAAIRETGLSPVHRASFCGNFLKG